MSLKQFIWVYRVRSIFIHIGTHKTGTTSIQYTLSRLRDELRLEGILVPHAGTLNSEPKHRDIAWMAGHHNLPWELYGDYRFNPKNGTVADLIQELKHSDLETAVISAEDFEFLSKHKDELKQFDLQLEEIGFRRNYIAFFREEFSYFASLLPTLRILGVRTSEEELREEYLKHRSLTVFSKWHFDFDKERFIQNIEDSIGKNLVAVDFDPLGLEVVPNFLKMIGTSEALIGKARQIPAQNRNPAYRFQPCPCGSGVVYDQCHGKR